MVSIQPRARHGCDKELRSVRIRTTVRHGEQSRTCVLQREVLVCEAFAVDRLTSTTVSVSEIASLGFATKREGKYLAHKLGNDTMQCAALVVQRLSHLALSLFSGAQATEILRSFGNYVSTELLH